jgi:hypothetical protein
LTQSGHSTDRISFGIIRIHFDNYVGGLRSCVGPDPHRFRAPSPIRSESPTIFSTRGLDRNSFHNDPIDLVGCMGVSRNRLDVSKVCLPICFTNPHLFRDHTSDSTQHCGIRCGPREALQQGPATNRVVILRRIGGSIRGWSIARD